MAGMLPGVEAARRRRCHNQGNLFGSELISQTTFGSIRRSSFCLYAGGYHLNSASSMQRNIPVSQQAACDESSLGAAAREAKKRLDERLQQQWRSDTNRPLSSQQRLRSLEDKPIIQADLQREKVHKLKKSGSKRLNWLKLNWKASEQEECAVCLERFKAGRGKTLMHLPCGHKFHTNCLVPWLESNAHCPCCRMEIPS